MKTLAYLLFFHWLIFVKNIAYVKLASFLAGILSVFLSLWFLGRLRGRILALEGLSSRGNMLLIKDSFKEQWLSVKAPFFLGVILLSFTIAFLNFTGREIARGMNSSHGSIAQFGYSIIIGTFLYLVFKIFLNFKNKIRAFVILTSIFFGAGVFFNNMNLDLYFNSWHEQNKFIKAFVSRFPTLPNNAQFMIDASDNAQYYTQLDNYYKLEFLINLYYARDADPHKFRNYAVYSIEEFNLNPDMVILKNSRNVTFSRYTHLGKETIDSEDLIILTYKNDELLVNREVLNKYPDAPYREWADKSFPVLPQAVQYSLRHKLRLNE